VWARIALRIEAVQQFRLARTGQGDVGQLDMAEAADVQWHAGNLASQVFMAASRTPGVAPTTAIATVSSLSYLGFLAGPPLLGDVAQLSNLG
jgi:hypothetical protein